LTRPRRTWVSGRRREADAGYWSEDEVKRASKLVDVYVATTKEWKQRKTLRGAKSPRGRIPKGLSRKERMERKLRTKPGRAVYKLRGATIEPRFGCIKEEQGMRGFPAAWPESRSGGVAVDLYRPQLVTDVADGRME
jgi:transposase